MLAHTIRRANTLVYGAIVSTVLFYAFVLLPNGYFEIPRLKTQDLFFRAAHALNPLPTQIKDIAVVVIDDESLSIINQKWPWEREHYAYVVEQIQRAKPRVVGFDIVFLGKSVNRFSDVMLASSLRQAGNVILASYGSENGAYVKPYELFANSAAGFGLINKPRDIDNLVRSGRLWMRTNNESSIMDYTFETKLLCHYFQIGTQQLAIYPDEAIFSRPWSLQGEPASDIHIPLHHDGTFLINYIARPRDFFQIPIWKVIKGQFDPSDFEGKMVLIGQTNEIIHDIHPTPLGEMPGVFISANALLTVLSDRFIKEMSPLSSGMHLLLFALLTLWIAMRWDVGKGAMACAALLVAYGFYSFFLFRKNLVGDFFSVPFFICGIFVFIQLYRNLILFIENLALKQDAITDGLTGLYIHKYLLVRLQNELDRTRRYQHKMALALLDIDLFKRFNDTYGHEEGNKALMHFAKIFRESFRKVDLLFRYGGEEFCVVMPGNDVANAWESVERFRKNLENSPLRVGSKDVSLHVSIGLVSIPEVAPQGIHDFLEMADKALYEAKKAGRNRTCRYENPPAPNAAA